MSVSGYEIFSLDKLQCCPYLLYPIVGVPFACTYPVTELRFQLRGEREA